MRKRLPLDAVAVHLLRGSHRRWATVRLDRRPVRAHPGAGRLQRDWLRGRCRDRVRRQLLAVCPVPVPGRIRVRQLLHHDVHFG